MAGILKAMFGAIAGAAAVSGAYFMGKDAGRKEARSVAQANPVEVPRPGLRGDEEQVKQVCRDPEAFHEGINQVSQDLRRRVADQVFETASVNAEHSGYAVQEGAEALVGSDALAESGAQDDSSDEGSPDQDDDPEPCSSGGDTGEMPPYERIRKALSTTELFDETNGQAYKPTPFSMPGKPQ